MLDKMIVVIPCYNEGLRLPTGSFLAYLEHQKNVGLLFVNDGSSDNTLDVLQKLKASNPLRIDILHLPNNRGKGEAIRRGISSVLSRQPTSCQYIGYWDADLSTPLEALSTLSDILKKHPSTQMVSGARVKLAGGQVERKPARHFAGRVFATVAGTLLGIHHYDTQCGAKIFRINSVTHEIFARNFHTRWLFDIELIVRMSRHSSPTREVPLEVWRDVDGSKVTFKEFLRAGFELLKIFYIYRLSWSRPFKSRTLIKEEGIESGSH